MVLLLMYVITLSILHSYMKVIGMPDNVDGTPVNDTWYAY